MRKKRIRYSELDAPAVNAPSAAAPVAVAPVAESPVVVPPSVRPKRVSSPVELARALAGPQDKETASAAETTVAAAPDSRPRPESTRAPKELVDLLMLR